MKKYAFTLTELMVALGIIGILAAVLLPIIFNLLPNQNTIMAKRVYYATQEIVSDLINDDACYPDKTMLDSSNAKVGFDDGSGYISCSEYTSGSSTSDKFTKLFTSRLDVKSGAGTTSFTTKDGVKWDLDFTNSGGFQSNDSTSFVYLVVDVNGTSGKPNCGQNTYSGQCSPVRTSGWDKFAMKIFADGGIEVLDDWAGNAIDINKDITAE